MAKLKLNGVRIAFPCLWEPKTVAGEGAPAFSATFIIPKDHPQVKEIEDLITQLATEKWAAKAPAILTQLKASDKVALHNGDTKAGYDGFPGNFFISARNKAKPGVFDNKIDPATGKVGVLSQVDGKPYAGCYVNGTVDIWAMDNNFGKRICASLLGVQFLKDGDAFSGSAPASADEYEAVAEEEDKTAKMA